VGFLKGRVTLVRVFAALLALDIVLTLTHAASGFATLLTVSLVIIGAILAIRYTRIVLRKSIWRLRNRLFVTYVFIGVVPIVLILTLAALGTYIVVGQVAVYLLTSELERRAGSLAAPVRLLSEARPADRPALAAEIGRLLEQRMPGLQLITSGIPAVNLSSYTGYTIRDGKYYSASILRSGGAAVAALAPITPEVLNQIAPGMGALNIGDTGLAGNMLKGQIAGAIPAPYNGFEWLDFQVTWVNPIHAMQWDKPEAMKNAFIAVATRPSAVLGAVFSNGIEFAQGATYAFVLVAFLLLVGELISLVIGVSLTRTITRAVHELYEGTREVAKGNFTWRIPVKGQDQLAALGKSFNEMTAQIEHLVVIAKEKERLQSEVEIASEVQNQLFPRSAPAMRTIELVGVCQAARMVSGDYYDYLCLPNGSLALAIGDVAGKGISAALLMASIQSIMRTQLAAGLPLSAAAGNGGGPPRFSTSSVVAQLNRQLYASTAPEKYATFFFGVYDEHSRILSYTNAGHLQPLLVRRGGVQSLEVTGTVVGAFPSIRYEEQTIEIASGDLLIAYTDGITEPENAYGEEFGAERLAETALRYLNSEPVEIVAKIMEAVTNWSTAPELPDDMTVVIARGLG
jgi:phosphoserine phosphatase RsbU/P